MTNQKEAEQKEGKEVAIIEKYNIVPESMEEIRDAMETNLDGEELSPRDIFTTVKTPAAGGTMWSVPTFDGEIDTKIIDGIILFIDHNRAFFEGEYGDEDVSPVPLCSSMDCVVGTGEPGGDCESCENNQYGSAPKGGGKACREVRPIYFLIEGEAMPMMLKVAAGSFKPLKEYRLKLLKAGIKLHQVETRFTLKKVKNPAGIAYSEIEFNVHKRIQDKGTIKAIETYRQKLEPFIKPVPAKKPEPAPEPAVTEQMAS